jgi:DNA polymerase-1
MANYYTPWVQPSRGIAAVYTNITHPLQEAIMQVENNGVFVSKERLLELAVEYAKKIEQAESAFYEKAGRVIEYTRNAELSHWLYQELELPVLLETKGGAPSTALPVLAKLEKMHEGVGALMKLKKLVKLKKDFLDGNGGTAKGLLPFIGSDGRIHSNYRVDGTETGRLSSAGPNLQNISNEPDIRGMFRARPGYVMMEADYSQLELRIAAILSGDPNMLGAFASGHDFHRVTASLMFKVPVDQVTDYQRKLAKAINFGVLYGMGAHSLAFRLDITVEEAEEYIREWFRAYKYLYRWLRDNLNKAKANGFVDNPFGRRRHLAELRTPSQFDPNWKRHMSHLGRAANNFPIQSTGSDLLSLSTISLILYPFNEFVDTGAIPIMSLHDALYFEVPEENADKASKIVKEVMEGIPAELLGKGWKLIADPKITHYWGEEK